MFQIYVPQARGCDPHQLVRLGLGDLLDPHVTCMAISVDEGPDGGPGVCFHWPPVRSGLGTQDSRLTAAGHFADEQIWAPCKPHKASGRPAAAFWLGKTKGEVIRPAEIARPIERHSAEVTLGDGQRWRVPIAVRLPHRLALDDDGATKRTIESAYRRFYSQAEEYWGQFVGYSAQRLTLPDLFASIVGAGGFDFCCEALALNYRINRDLVDWLELLTEDSVVKVVAAVLELGALDDVAAQKKTAE